MIKRQPVPIGTRFGYLTTVSDVYRELPTPTSKTDNAYIEVICDCGIKKKVAYYSMKSGSIKSCGCKINEWQKGITHNLRSHKLYSIWGAMKRRCHNPKVWAYKYYGARGIEVCSEWRKYFIPFYEWAIKNGWKDGLQIDRINVNGNYTPENCRFITKIENSRSRRDTILNMEKANEIRSLWNQGGYSNRELGIKFGVHKSTIKDITHNRTWQ